MAEQLVTESAPVLRGEPHPGTEVREEPGLVDGVRFLYQRRVRLAVRFIVCLGIGFIGLLVSYVMAPPTVQGTVGLSFNGIEKHEYPSGRKFTVEIFRSPSVLTRALGDAGILQANLSLRRISAGILVTPIIPTDVQSRWMKQEKDGARKDEYFPNEFRISLQIAELSHAQQLRLFDAIVKSFQERVKYEQKAALSFVGEGEDLSYEKLATMYDLWDIPTLFMERSNSLDRELQALTTEALQYQDATYQLRFREIARQLHSWQLIRLSALEAATYQGRLVTNRDLTIQRLQHRLEDVDLQIKKKAQEANEGLRLLGLIDRSSTLVANRLNNDRSLPAVDLSVLERLLKNDYVAPLVTKVSKLQSDAQELEMEKGRLQKQVAVLPKATNVDLKQVPPVYQELIRVSSLELGGIVRNFNQLLDDYLTAVITSLVAIRQSPIVMREGYTTGRLALIVVGVIFLSVFMAIFVMSVEHLYQKAKMPTPGASDVTLRAAP